MVLMIFNGRLCDDVHALSKPTAHPLRSNLQEGSIALESRSSKIKT
jgi:hypothetical protein